jgi:two-component system, LuxR family, response regulator FixJ
VHQATIYVVEDDDAVRDALQVYLEALNFTVVAFSSARAFLDHQRPPGHDCLLTDVHMPEMSGLELLTKLRRDKKTMPTVVMTGNETPDIRSAVEAEGAALLIKPFRQRELIAAIEAALRQAPTPRSEIITAPTCDSPRALSPE